MVRIILVICCISLGVLFFSAQSDAGRSSHMYVTGKIEAIDNTTIFINGQKYTLNSKCRFVRMSADYRALKERPASRSDLAIGRDVTVKSYGGMVHEIIINDWKR